MSDTDDLVVECCRQVAARMTATGLRGADLRESRHLDPFLKDAITEATGVRPVSRRLLAPEFTGLGAVDIVCERPPLLMELKWSYDPPGKVFESVWDAVKLAVLGARHGWSHLYLATGASGREWAHGDCVDLFATGVVDLREMWGRPLVPLRSPNRGATVGEDLVIGGRGNQPSAGPAEVSTRALEAFPVASDFTLKLIRVAPAAELLPWPQVAYPGA